MCDGKELQFQAVSCFTAMVHCQLGLAWKCEIFVMLYLVLTESTLRSARVAQWIRRRSPKPKIGGSSPPVGTHVFDGLETLGTNHCGVSQHY